MSVLAFLLWSFWTTVSQTHQVVLLFPDGRIEAVSASSAMDAQELRGVEGAWVWSLVSSPQRVGPQYLAQRHPRKIDRRLLIHVRSGPEGHEPAPSGLFLTAAPVEMWQEIPEPLLPSWLLPRSGHLSVPMDAARRWRLRLAGGSAGSWWMDVPPGQRQVTIPALPAQAITFEVMDAGGGTPSRAALQILEGSSGRLGGERQLAFFRGDEQGRFSVPALPDLAELTWIVGDLEHPPVTLRGLPSHVPSRITLGTGATVLGSCRDSRGQPLSGVEVRFAAWAGKDVPITFSRATKSDATGAWKLQGVPAGEVSLFASRDGLAPVHRLLAVSSPEVDVGILTLTPGVSLRVQILDDAAQPVPGARVKVGAGRALVTDSQGVAKLTSLPEEASQLTAEAEGHLPAKTGLEPPFPREISVSLERAAGVKGRFLDSEGSPFLEASVRIEAGVTSRTEPLSPDGSFSLSLEPGREHVLKLSATESAPLRITIPAGAPGEIRDLGDLHAQPAFEIAGRIVDADTGAAIAGARVWCPRPSPAGPLLAWMERDLLQTASDAEGLFRLRGLLPGPVTLRVDAPGYARARLDQTVSNGHPVTRAGDVRVTRGVQVDILVGEGAEDGAIARIDPGLQGLDLDILSAPVVEGVAQVRRVPPGTALISVIRGRILLCEKEVRLPADEPAVQVECPATGMVVQGTVQVGGQPAGPGFLAWMPQAGQIPEGIVNFVAAGGLKQTHVFSANKPQVDVPVDATGRFVTRDLRPGRWDVIWFPESGAPTEPRKVELPSGREHAVVLAFPGLAIEGVVLDGAGKPVEGARVRELTGGATSFTGADGGFTLGGLRPVLNSFEAQSGDLRSDPVQVDLSSRQAHEPLTLILKESAAQPALAIRVLGPEGLGAANSFVFVEAAGQGLQVLTTDAEGKVDLLLRPPYPEVLRAAAFSAGNWTFGSWTRLEEARDGISLEIGRVGSLALRTRQGRGTLQITAPGGWNLTLLLAFLGSNPSLGPESPLGLTGLPGGAYVVRLAEVSETVNVRAGEQAEVQLEPDSR